MRLRVGWTDGFQEPTAKRLPRAVWWRAVELPILSAHVVQGQPGPCEYRIEWAYRWDPRRVLAHYGRAKSAWKSLHEGTLYLGWDGSTRCQIPLRPPSPEKPISKAAQRIFARSVRIHIRPRDDETWRRAERDLLLVPPLHFVLALVLLLPSSWALLELVYRYHQGQLAGGVLAGYLTVGGLAALVPYVTRKIRGETWEPALCLWPALILAGALFVAFSFVVEVQNTTSQLVALGGIEHPRNATAWVWDWEVPSRASLEANYKSSRFKTPEIVGDAWSRLSDFRFCNLDWPLGGHARIACPKSYCSLCSDRYRSVEAVGASQDSDHREGGNVREYGRRTCRNCGKAIEVDRRCQFDPERVAAVDAKVAIGASQLHTSGVGGFCEGSYRMTLAQVDELARGAGERFAAARTNALLQIDLPRAVSTDGGDASTKPVGRLRWVAPPDRGDGYLALEADLVSGCHAMVPVRKGTFQVELATRNGVRGTLRCPSAQRCPHGFVVEPAFDVSQSPPFDGLVSYSENHGQSVWTPQSGRLQAYVCRCQENARKRSAHEPGLVRPATQASLRLERVPQSSLNVVYPDQLPSRLDIAAGDDRSVLRCGVSGASPVRLTGNALEVQLQSFKSRLGTQTHVVRPKELDERATERSECSLVDGFRSTWRWIEGSNTAWACTLQPTDDQASRKPASRTSSSKPVADRPNQFAWQVATESAQYEFTPCEAGPGEPCDPITIRNCYVHPWKEEIKYMPIPNVGCGSKASPHQWADANPEYRREIRRRAICARVKVCRQ